MLGYLGFVFEIEEQERDGHKVLQIFTHEADRLIGRREQTLDDLQFLLNRILQARNPKAARVVVDVDHHRAMRDDALIAKVCPSGRGGQGDRTTALRRSRSIPTTAISCTMLSRKTRHDDLESARRCQAQAHHYSFAKKSLIPEKISAIFPGDEKCRWRSSFFRCRVCWPVLRAQEPIITAESAVLFDANSGKVIFKKNENERRPVASTQKLLTALIIAESGDLSAPVTIDRSDMFAAPTKLYLKTGDAYTRQQLLDGAARSKSERRGPGPGARQRREH